MPSDGFHRTHALLTDAYADALARAVDALLPHADAGLVRTDEPWLSEDPDGDDCRETWEAVRGRFDRRPERDDGSRAAWCVAVGETDGAEAGGETDGAEALGRLVGLADGVVGPHFLFEVELAREGRTLLSATPHHSDLGVDADALPESTLGEVESALSGLPACLVAADPFAEWEAENRLWRVGSAVCRETPDGDRTSCYGVSNLRGVAVAADGTALELTWGLGGPVSDDPIGRALSWGLDRLYRPPERLPCGDADRAESVAAFLAATLRRFDGREIRTG